MKHLTEEHKENIRKGLLGKKRPTFSKEWLENMSKCRKGKKISEEHKRKISLSKIREKNPMWRGDKVGYSQLHAWIKTRLPKTELCQCCKKVPPLDLANKGIYNRDLENWEWLCRRCHMTKDGRIEKFKNLNDKITYDDAVRIRFMFNKLKMKPFEIKKHFNISIGHIRDIIKEKYWKFPTCRPS